MENIGMNLFDILSSHTVQRISPYFFAILLCVLWAEHPPPQNSETVLCIGKDYMISPFRPKDLLLSCRRTYIVARRNDMPCWWGFISCMLDFFYQIHVLEF